MKQKPTGRPSSSEQIIRNRKALVVNAVNKFSSDSLHIVAISGVKYLRQIAWR
ncbi:MAG: hypothetical protein IIA10_05190 [Proteobacteria bacterium]|nr:hypothetical protein [Pseudomonadota bacterium]